MDINRLDKDELAYELTYRGVATGTVEEMRSRLSMARQMEQAGDSLHYPDYPFTFKEDVDVVTKKLDALVEAVEQFTETTKSGTFAKLQTKINFCISRSDNITPRTTEEKKIKAELLAQALSLLDKLNSKILPKVDNALIPPSLAVLEGSVMASAPISCSSPMTREPAQSQHSPEFNIKPILPHKWNLKFTGDRRGMSVTAFFERVDELRIARNVNKAILLNSGIDLFEGRAYEFYLDCRNEVSSWEELVQKFKEEYQPAFYTEKLLEEIKRRTQGPDESVGTYLAVMSKYFQRLECPISEEAKLTILLRNISPVYRNQIGALEINNIAELKSLCRRIETRMQSEYAPPPRKNSSLEPDLAYIETPYAETFDLPVPGTSHVAAVAHQSQNNRIAKTSKDIICFNCDKPGHRAIGCAEPKRKRCYGCKKEGVTKATCPNCRQGNGRRHS